MGIKLKDSVRNEYLEFQMKIMLRFCVNAVISVAAVIVLYLFLWRQRGGNLIVWFLEHFIRMEHEQAFLIYHYYFRNCKIENSVGVNTSGLSFRKHSCVSNLIIKPECESICSSFSASPKCAGLYFL